MEGFRLFAPIAKVDAQKRLVYGIAASESEDKSGERFDYESSAPEFKKWSTEIAKGSQGKSLGNVRVMHQPVVAGVLVDLRCDDAAKTISVCAKVVSEDAWKMVEAGAYTGFSIGGRYGKRWSDSGEPSVKWYTAIPSEISLVDNPCNPDAYFQFIKADGLTERRGFAGVQALGGAAAHPGSSTAIPIPSIDHEGEFAEKRGASPHTADGVMQRWLAKDGSAHLTKAAAMARNEEIMKGPSPDGIVEATLEAALGPAAAPPPESPVARGEHSSDAIEEGHKPYGGVEYADPGWQADKKRRYPIDTKRHIRAAWSYIHKPMNARCYSAEHLAEIKRRIIAAWKEKIESNGPPEAGDEKSDKGILALMLAKHLSDTGEVARIILGLKALKERLRIEAEMEGDDPRAHDVANLGGDQRGERMPARVQALIEELCAFLKDLVAKETAEVIADEEGPQIFIPEQIFLAVPAGELKKGSEKASMHTRGHRALLDLAGNAVAMARLMPALTSEEKERWERCAEHLMLAGANVPAIHQEAVEAEHRHAGPEVLATAAHHLVGKVREAGGHPKEVASNLDRVLEHLEALGAHLHQATLTHPEKRAADSGLQARGQFDILLKAVAALNDKATESAERLSKLAAENEALRGRLERVEKEPLPPKTVSLPAGVNRISKSADNAGSLSVFEAGWGMLSDPESADRIAKMSEEERAMLLIKASYRNPLRPQFAGPETGRPEK